MSVQLIGGKRHCACGKPLKSQASLRCKPCYLALARSKPVVGNVKPLDPAGRC